jgi:hypothetical protein
MAVPRPLLLSLLGTFLLAATFLTMRNAQSTSQKVANPVVPAQPAAPKTSTPAKPAAPAKPALLSSQDAIRAIVSPGTPLKSARFAVALDSRELAGRHAHESVALAGRFEGPSGQRSFDIRSASASPGRRSSGRVVSSGGSAFVFVHGKAYGVPPRAMKLTSKLRQALTGSGQSSAAKLPALDPAPWMKHVKVSDGGKVAGVPTTHVTGVVNSQKMAKDVKKLFKAAASGSAQPASLPQGFGRDFAQVFKGATLDAYVGTQDKIVRKLRVSVTGAEPKSVLDPGDSARWRSVLSLGMRGVNQPQKIVAPKGPAKAKLHGKAARSAQGDYLLTATVMDPPGGLAQTAIGFLRVNAVAKATRVPNKVDRAIKAHKRVVLFFRQNKGADDDATAQAVRDLRRRTNALVVSDTVNNLASYGAVVQSAGVARAPSVVIIGKTGRAQLIEGYIDPEALAQEVADTR